MAIQAVLVAGVLACGPIGLLAQSPATSPQKPKRPHVAVMPFDYGTISDQWWGDRDIGKGVADQIVDALVNDGTFIVVERSKLDTVLAEQDFAHSNRAEPKAASLAKVGKVLGVKYILTGSITKFGTEEKNINAGPAGVLLGPAGNLNLKKAKTEVALTGHLVDTTSGEVVVAGEGSGLSKKGGGVSARSMNPLNPLGSLGAPGGGAGGGVTAPEYRSSAIGEAQELATQALVRDILDKLAAQQ